MAEDPMKLILAKLDSFETRLSSLEPKEDSTPKEDPLKDKATAAIRKLLTPTFKEDALKKMSLEELIIAATLKEDFEPEVGIVPPTGGKAPKVDSRNDIPEAYRAHYNTDTSQELIG